MDLLVNRENLVLFFVIEHRCLVALLMRKMPASKKHATKHPFASFFVFLVTCFAAPILTDLLLGNPIIAVFFQTKHILLSLLVWYLVFFSPYDIAHKIISSKLILLLLMITIEVPRITQCSAGIQALMKAFPNASKSELFIPAVFVGFINGGIVPFILTPLDSFIRGSLTTTNEFLKLSLPGIQPGIVLKLFLIFGSTKEMTISSIVLTLLHVGFINVDETKLKICLFTFTVLLKMLVLVVGVKDPYTIITGVVTGMFLHGDFEEDIVKNDDVIKINKPEKSHVKKKKAD